MLEDPRWRAVLIGVTLGSVPLIALLWRFVDPHVEAWSATIGADWPRQVGRLGLAEVWLVPAVIATAVMAVLGRIHGARWGLFLISAVIASGVVVNLLKIAIGRERPQREDPLGPWAFSFPSGHTTTIATVATVIVLRWPRLWPAAIPLVAIVAAARVCDHGHHLSDVVAGAVLGVAVTLVLEVAWSRWWRME